MLTVLKPFPHPFRRFAIGQEIAEVDLVGSPISATELKRGRFVAGSETKLAEKAAEKVEPEVVIDPPPIPEGATQFEVEAIVAESVPAKKSKTA